MTRGRDDWRGVNEQEDFGPMDFEKLVRHLSVKRPSVPRWLVEDAVSEAVLAWWEQFGRHGQSVSVAWVIRRAAWMLCNELRRLRPGNGDWTVLRLNRRTAWMRQTDEAASPEQAVERAEVLRLAARARLTPEGALIVARWLAGWTAPEIAEEMGIESGAVRQRVHRSIQQFRREVAAHRAPDNTTHELRETSHVASLVFLIAGSFDERDGLRFVGKSLKGGVNAKRKRGTKGRRGGGDMTRCNHSPDSRLAGSLERS